MYKKLKKKSVIEMSSHRVVSRSELYGDAPIETSDDGNYQGSDDESNQEVEKDMIMVDPPFEETEVLEDESNTQEGEPDFEYFPLFSSGELTKVTIEENEKVSDVMEEEIKKQEDQLAEQEIQWEYVKRERTEDYYFARYSTLEKEQFKQSAIEIDTLLNNSYPRTLFGKKDHSVLDIDVHNKNIDEELLRSQRIKKRRPGKKQRLARKLGKQHEEERTELKKNLKKRFRKRGGKKNKKPKLNPLANAGAEIKA